MKRSFVLLVSSFLLLWPIGRAHTQGDPGKPESLDERISYSIGVNIAQNLAQQGIDLRVEMLVQGLRDGLGGGATLLSIEEMQSALQTLQGQLQARQQEQRETQSAQNKKEGEEFLAANAQREEVVTLPSGLQYQVLEEGDGPVPEAGDQVTVHYRGTLIDGTTFDSSYDRGEPVTFPVEGVIPGWTEALQLMPVGSKWKLYVPADLAYGERGAGNLIGPNQTLIFEVELLGIADNDE